MKIAIIGYGNLGWHLESLLASREDMEVHIYSRSNAVFENSKSKHLKSLNQIDNGFNIVFCAVNDHSISEVCDKLYKQGVKDTLVVHSSGAGSLTLMGKLKRKAGMWPLMSLKKGLKIDWGQVPVFINATTKADKELLGDLAKSITSSVHFVSEADRLKYHLAAVMSNNFSNYCITKAYELLEKSKLDPKLLFAILEQQIQALSQSHPKTLQTGPATRGDQSTMNMHRSILNKRDLEFYDYLSNEIKKN